MATPLEQRHAQLRKNDLARLAMIKSLIVDLGELVHDSGDDVDVLALAIKVRTLHHLAVVAAARRTDALGDQSNDDGGATTRAL